MSPTTPPKGLVIAPKVESYSYYHEDNLKYYDFWILYFNSKFVWRCPSTVLEEHFAAHITTNHCDIGAGTGYFIERMRKRGKLWNCHLIDANPVCLEWARKRLGNETISTQLADVLQPLEPLPRPVDSISMNYLIHCLPGPLRRKQRLFDNLHMVGASGCKVFGSTVIGKGVHHSLLAKVMLHILNRNNMFDTRFDDLDAIRNLIRVNLTDVSFRIVGSVLLFAGRLRAPKTTEHQVGL